MPEQSPVTDGQPPIGSAPEPDGGGLGADVGPGVLPAKEPFRSILRWLARVEQSVAVILLVAILALVLLQVGQRYLPRGFAWTGEVARFAMVWLTFVMSGTLLAQDAHIAIKVVDYFLPSRVLGAVKLLGHALITVTCIVMLYGTYDFMGHDRGQVTAAAQIPLALIYTVIAFGFASTAIRAILTILVLDLPQVRTGVKATA